MNEITTAQEAIEAAAQVARKYAFGTEQANATWYRGDACAQYIEDEIRQLATRIQPAPEASEDVEKRADDLMRAAGEEHGWYDGGEMIPQSTALEAIKAALRANQTSDREARLGAALREQTSLVGRLLTIYESSEQDIGHEPLRPLLGLLGPAYDNARAALAHAGDGE